MSGAIRRRTRSTRRSQRVEVRDERRDVVGGGATVTALGDGRFRADGLMFHMAGRWELQFDVQRTAGRVADLLRGFGVDEVTPGIGRTGVVAVIKGKTNKDIGDILGPRNHADIAAAILKPFVSEANLWMVQNHGIFQGYNFFHHIGMDRNMRDMFKDHPHYARTEEFIALYDDPAFDSSYDTLPIETFEPLLRKVMAQPVNSVYKEALKA